MIDRPIIALGCLTARRRCPGCCARRRPRYWKMTIRSPPRRTPSACSAKMRRRIGREPGAVEGGARQVSCAVTTHCCCSFAFGIARNSPPIQSVSTHPHRRLGGNGVERRMRHRSNRRKPRHCHLHCHLNAPLRRAASTMQCLFGASDTVSVVDTTLQLRYAYADWRFLRRWTSLCADRECHPIVAYVKKLAAECGSESECEMDGERAAHTRVILRDVLGRAVHQSFGTRCLILRTHTHTHTHTRTHTHV